MDNIISVYSKNFSSTSRKFIFCTGNQGRILIDVNNGGNDLLQFNLKIWTQSGWQDMLTIKESIKEVDYNEYEEWMNKFIDDHVQKLLTISIKFLDGP